MTISDGIAILALLVSIYSIYLARSVDQREKQRELRKIQLLLEYVFQINGYKLLIVNIGYRPVTITGVDVNFTVDDGTNRYGDGIPANFIFHPSVEDPFPIILTDGKSVTLRMNEFMTPEWIKETLDLEIVAYDAERNSYRLSDVEPYNYEVGNYPGV